MSYTRRRIDQNHSRHISPFFGFTGRFWSEYDPNARRNLPCAVMVLGSYFFDREDVRPQLRQANMSLDIIEGLLRNGQYTDKVGGPEGAATQRQLEKARDALRANRSSYRY